MKTLIFRDFTLFSLIFIYIQQPGRKKNVLQESQVNLYLRNSGLDTVY